jgi:hypothetical protein
MRGGREEEEEREDSSRNPHNSEFGGKKMKEREGINREREGRSPEQRLEWTAVKSRRGSHCYCDPMIPHPKFLLATRLPPSSSGYLHQLPFTETGTRKPTRNRSKSNGGEQFGRISYASASGC